MGSLSIFQPRRVASLCLLMALLAGTALAQTLATTVPLVMPSAIAFDGQGNLYLADTANHVIRKVDPAGHITTVVGTGTQGFSGDGGVAPAALLDSPQGVAVNSANLYIADTHNHRIRRVQLATGIITTVAGASSIGSSGDNGPASAATLDAPTALALDNKGNLYLADTRGQRIRRIDALTGVITTVAGTGAQGFEGDGGAATAASMDSPGGLAVDSNGNLYLADTHNHRIRRIDTATGAITTVAGTGVSGFAGDNNSATTAKLTLPHGISIDTQGNIYISDTANHRIRRIDGATGIITTIAGEGTQGFAGDGGIAAGASLDSPRATAVSPSGSATIADTDNQRIRQIASGTLLHTIAGLGTTIPGSLALNGPAVVSYGSGHITAIFTTTSSVTGAITFLDSYAASSNTAAVIPLAGATAVFDTSQLAAGDHAITATYTGDSTHGAAQSTVFALAVSPLPLTAVITPASVSYGETPPSITGLLSGVLLRDQSAISATFSTTAAALSPAGSYPVTVTLAGAAAGNYTLAASPAFTITPAPTVTTLSIAPAPTTVNSGDPVTFAVHVVSQTNGNPTGSVAILDGSSMIATGNVNSAGDMVFTSSTLNTGSHVFLASYSGDANFKASNSSRASLTVNGSQTPADFTLTPTGATTQSIISGTSATFTFGTSIQNGLSSSISLSASGLPNLATAAFNPAYIPPGSTSTTFTLTIATPKTAGLERRIKPPGTSIILALLFFPLGLFVLRRSPIGSRIPLLGMLILLAPLFCMGCGDRIYTGTRSTDASKTYTIAVTGTATSPAGTSLQHTATVTLVVLPAS